MPRFWGFHTYEDDVAAVTKPTKPKLAVVGREILTFAVPYFWLGAEAELTA